MNTTLSQCWRRGGRALAFLGGTACTVLGMTGEAFAQVSEQLPQAQEAVSHSLAGIPPIWWVAPIGAVIALIFAWIFYKGLLRSDEGDEDMKRVSGYVRTGAMAYLKQQYKVVAVFFLIVSAILFWMGWSLHVQHKIVFVAFLTGGFFSGLCGWLGMNTATRASHRTAAGARKSLNDGLVVAFRSGAVMGLVVVGFGLIDICLWFLLLYGNVLPFEFTQNMTLNDITVVMLTFGMGASTQALFARVGGGIYTKAADVGADLVGKVEAGIPEDDPRNPATIADNVGDNVGDVAGMGADLYESYCGSILATAALGVAAAAALFGDAELGEGFHAAIKLLSAPMVLAGIGILLSIIGIYMVRTREGATMGQLLNALRTGVYGSSVLIALAALGVCYYMLGDIAHVSWLGVWGAIMAGLVAGNVIGYATEYYTSYENKPVKGIAEQGQTGPATVIISGIAVGMKSTWASITTVIVAIICAFVWAGGSQEFLLGLYGIGISAVGMLATLGITLATDAYGPIADNAGGNAEMTGQKPEVRHRTDALDSLGNTTAATGKGFAIGSAALTALALLAAYVEEVRIGQVREAGAYVQQVADKQAPSAIGAAWFYADGKIAQRIGSGKTDGDFEAFMILSPDDSDFIKPDTAIVVPPASARTAEGVRETTLRVDRDGDGVEEEVELRIVAARKASLAQYMDFYNVTLMNPQVLCGMFAGVLLVFIFCAMTMEAVGRAAYRMMLECREQFGKMRAWLKSQGKSDAEINDPENWPRKQIEFNGEKVPDYSKAVAISTKGAQREMVVPSLLAVVVPVVVGLVLDVAGVMGLLAGGLTAGFAVAVFMANAGGAWDNAKKFVESGQFGGKRSECHKATVVGDTVGDPFKDTSGPSLNILIKLMSMVSVVFAGLVVKYAPEISRFLGL